MKRTVCLSLDAVMDITMLRLVVFEEAVMKILVLIDRHRNGEIFLPIT